MGFFKKFKDNVRNGGFDRSIECKTCGKNYTGNIDELFPYSICISCIELEIRKSTRNGEQNEVNQLEWELNRRRGLR